MYSFRASRIFMDKQAFTLVEMSIVLVIIGLLVGGVLSGQSLIRAAELRAVSSEYQKYTAAENAFRDKYMAIPGDMNNAASFWPTTPSGTATVNGNGDGQVLAATAATTQGEMFNFWNELAQAGIIEGSYSGYSGGAGGADCVLGSNVPKSKVTNSGWGIEYFGTAAPSALYYTYNYGNSFIFGAQSAGTVPSGVSLKPEEAWNLDTKLDDGKPDSGKVVGVGLNATATSSCSVTSAGAAPAQAGASTDTYNLTQSSQLCALAFTRVF